MPQRRAKISVQSHTKKPDTAAKGYHDTVNFQMLGVFLKGYMSEVLNYLTLEKVFSTFSTQSLRLKIWTKTEAQKKPPKPQPKQPN